MATRDFFGPELSRSLGRRACAFAAIFLITLLVASGSLGYLDWASAPKDVVAYWQGGGRFLAGQDLYPTEPAAGRPYLYPPAFAACFSLFVRLDLRFGLALWSATHVVFGALLMRELHCFAKLHGARGWPWLAALLAFMLFRSFWTEQSEGQVNTLVALLVFTGLVRALRGREISGGLLLAAAVHVKVFPGVMLIVLLIQKRFRAALAMGIGLVAIGLLPSLMAIPKLGLIDGIGYGLGQHIQWLTNVMWPALSEGSLAGTTYYTEPNLSLRAVTYRWFVNDLQGGGPLLVALPEGLARAFSMLTSLTLAGGALFATWKSRGQEIATIVWATGALFALQLGNLLYWDHHLLLMAIPATCLYIAVFNGKCPRTYIALPLLLGVVVSLPHLLEMAVDLSGKQREMQPMKTSLTWGMPILFAIALVLLAGKTWLPPRTKPDDKAEDAKA
ncbi:MAG: DUF2029 domain-containing protein [Planctomycetes bacterium]|nr:DUF2029 domain-containing protein [Planctomycetota bacterium]